MSTIRPLATIAVLAVIGAFLALKINEGPAVALNEEWSSETPEAEAGGEPPAWSDSEQSLASANVVPSARTAPSWAESSPVASPAEEVRPAAVPVTPSFPSLPQLPKLDTPTTNPAPVEVPMPVKGQPVGTTLANESRPAPAFSTATQEKLELPDDIPQANYGGNDSPATPPKGVSGRVPSLGSSTPGYGQSTSPSTATSLSTPAESAPGFEAAWQGVQSALQGGQLPLAHRLLSSWRNDSRLSPEQQQRVESLLGQLAGTVVYSTEHRLEPPHIVAAGETLGTIAEKYEIPWQLLAKINGIPSTDAVKPGQTLKVVRGPFDAEVDLERGELTLLLDDRYAGKFPVRVEGVAPADGDWQVGQKRLDNAAATPEPKLVLQSPSGERVELSSSPVAAPGTKGRLTVASRDLGDLFDILSVGSSVTVRR